MELKKLTSWGDAVDFTFRTRDAWRHGSSKPITMRGATSRRALFFLHPSRPLLIAAWHQGDSLDAAKASRLFAAHDWELSDPPCDVVGLLDAGLPLQTVAEALSRKSTGT